MVTMKKTTSVDDLVEKLTEVVAGNMLNMSLDPELTKNLVIASEKEFKQQLLTLIIEAMPDSEIDLIKFERDKTGWIEEVGVDADTLTDKDVIAIYRLARHFKQQAIEDTLGNIRELFG